MMTHVLFAVAILVLVLLVLSRLLRNEGAQEDDGSDEAAEEAERQREQEELEAERIAAEERRREQVERAENYEFIPLSYLDVPKISPTENFLWISEVTQIVDNLIDTKNTIVDMYKGKLVFTNQRVIFDAESAFVDFKLGEIRRIKNDGDGLSFLLQDGHVLKFENTDIMLRIILNRILTMAGYT